MSYDLTFYKWFHWHKMLPSKPLTLDLMETLNLVFRTAWYHWNASYREMKRINVVENCWIYKFDSVHFCTWFTQRRYGTCKKRFNVSMRSEVRGFYITNLNVVKKIRQKRSGIPIEKEKKKKLQKAAWLLVSTCNIRGKHGLRVHCEKRFLTILLTDHLLWIFHTPFSSTPTYGRVSVTHANCSCLPLRESTFLKISSCVAQRFNPCTKRDLSFFLHFSPLLFMVSWRKFSPKNDWKSACWRCHVRVGRQEGPPGLRLAQVSNCF